MDGMIGSLLQVTLSDGCIYKGTLTSVDVDHTPATLRLQTADRKVVEFVDEQIVDVVMLEDGSNDKQEATSADQKQVASEESASKAAAQRSAKSKRTTRNVAQFDPRVKQPEKTRVRNEAVNTESTWMGAKFDGEFDFDGNLALFDKQAVYEEIDRGLTGTQSDNEVSRHRQTNEVISSMQAGASRRQPQVEVVHRERDAFSKAFARLPSVKDGQVYGAQDATFFLRKSESECESGAPTNAGYTSQPNVAADSTWLTPAGLRVCTVDRATRDRLVSSACSHFGALAVIEAVGRCIASTVLQRVLRNEFTVRCSTSSNVNGSVRNSPHPFAPGSSSKRPNANSKNAQSAASQTGSLKRRCVVLVLARANLRGAIAINCARHLATRHVDCAVLYFDDMHDSYVSEAMRQTALAQLGFFEEADGKTARNHDDIRALQLDAVDCVVNALLDGQAPTDAANADGPLSALSATARAILKWCDAHVSGAQQLLVDPPGDYDESLELSIAPHLGATSFSLTFGALDSLIAARCAAQAADDLAKKKSAPFGKLLFADAGITKRLYEATGFTFFQSPFAHSSETVLQLVHARLAKA